MATRSAGRYDHEDDGQIHTSWSDLKRCSTPHGALTVAKEMVHRKKRWGGDKFGEIRHRMWEKEVNQTGMTPACFQHIGIHERAIYPEKRYQMQLIPGVVLHSTIDLYLPDRACVTDYKTFTNHDDLQKYRQPAKMAQLLTYGLQLVNAGESVKCIMFMGERWDKAREELLGYDHVIIPVTMLDLIRQRQVLEQNARRLQVAVQLLEEKQLELSA